MPGDRAEGGSLGAGLVSLGSAAFPDRLAAIPAFPTLSLHWPHLCWSPSLTNVCSLALLLLLEEPAPELDPTL